MELAASTIADAINAESPTPTATADGAKNRNLLKAGGANGNRIGVCGSVYGAATESWEPRWRTLQGGSSPESWRVTLDFGHLRDIEGRTVPTAAVRKMR